MALSIARLLRSGAPHHYIMADTGSDTWASYVLQKKRLILVQPGIVGQAARGVFVIYWTGHSPQQSIQCCTVSLVL